MDSNDCASRNRGRGILLRSGLSPGDERPPRLRSIAPKTVSMACCSAMGPSSSPTDVKDGLKNPGIVTFRDSHQG